MSPAIKDLWLALAEAERAAVPMPAASLVNDRLVGMAAWDLPTGVESRGSTRRLRLENAIHDHLQRLTALYSQ